MVVMTGTLLLWYDTASARIDFSRPDRHTFRFARGRRWAELSWMRCQNQ